MEIDQLRRRLANPCPFDFDAALAEFQREGHGSGVDRFLSFLRGRDLIGASLFAELHSGDRIEVTRLLGVQPNRTLVFAHPEAATLSTDERKAAEPPSAHTNRAHYELLGRLGAGAMGEVHIARDLDLRRKVALKRMVPEVAQSQPLAARFFSEIQVTAQLDHPNIVPIYGLEVAPDGTLSYAMKLVQGRTLGQLLDEPDAAKDGRLAERLEVFLRVCDAIAYAHIKGVLHRDLKPENIMVGRYNEVYVMDWGICRLMGSDDDATDRSALGDPGIQRTQYGSVLGTPRYMSPEQAQGKNPELDGRSDLFTLGLILQELVTLRPARAGGALESVLVAAAEGAREPMPSATPELQAIVMRACSLHPEHRYPSVTALADDLRRSLRGEAIEALPDTLLLRIGRWIGRHRMATLAMLMGLLLVGATATIGALLHEERVLTRNRRHELSVQRFLTAVSRQSHAIDNQFHDYETQLAALAGRAVELLTHAFPGEERFFLSQDYSIPERAPPDLAPSRVHGQPISVDHPAFKLAPDVKLPEVEGSLRRLALLGGAFRDAAVASAAGDRSLLSEESARRLLLDEGTPLIRLFVSLENGVHAAYPGQGGFEPDYDGRKRPKYLLAARQRGIRWGNAYPDRLGHRLLLPGSLSLWDDRGQFLGVAGVDVTFDYIISHMLDLPRDSNGVTSYLVTENGQVVVESTEPTQLAGPPPGNAPLQLHPLPQPWVEAALRKKQRDGHVEQNGEIAAFHHLDALHMYYVVVANVEQLQK